MYRALVSITLISLPLGIAAAECPYKIGDTLEAQEINNKVAMHKTWVGSRGASGKQGQFCNLDLSEVNLAGQVLTNASFAGTTLTGARLDGANMHGADLREADLGSASLKSTILTKANLDGANLADANMVGANLRKASLVKATLRGAVLKAATLSKANLTGADLSDADLNNARVRRATLNEAQLVYTDLTNASLRQVEMQGALFDEVELKGADLHGIELAGNHFIKTNLKAARGTSAERVDKAMAWSAENKEDGQAFTAESADDDKAPATAEVASADADTQTLATAPPAAPEQAVAAAVEDTAVEDTGVKDTAVKDTGAPASAKADAGVKGPAQDAEDETQIAASPTPPAAKPDRAAAQRIASAPRPPTKKRKSVRTVPASRATDEPSDAGVYVQLGAGRSHSAAQDAVESLRSKHDSQLDGLPGRVSEFNHQQSGRWYRVLFGPVPDRSVAREVCEEIRSEGGDCILRLQQS